MSRTLAAALVAIAFSISLVASKSQLPDHDGSGLNNSFDKATPIDVLRIGPDGKANGLHLTEELGVVTGGFDTEDFYRFSIPAGTTWKLHFFMKETPDTTIFIDAFDDPKGPSVGGGRGNPFEQFTWELSGGDYFIRIATETGVARGRKLTYDLAVTPTFLPLPDLAGASCQGAQNLGANPNGRQLNGSIGPGGSREYYSFHLTGGAETQAVRFNAQYDNQIYVIDRNNGRRWLLAEPGRPRMDLRYLLDPGFYCLEIAASGPVTSNYYVQLITGVHKYSIGGTRGTASFVTAFNLGNLSENGRYKSTRYPDFGMVPSGLVPSREYTLREWIGPDEYEHWLQFSVPVKGRLTGGLSQLFNPVGIEIQDANGVTVATGQRSGTPLDDHLPSVGFAADIGPGTYYARVTYLGARGPGTNYALRIFYVPVP